MPLLDMVKANWDHLPPVLKKPKLPPGLFNLKARKIWLNHFRPTFTYGDERDKLQAKQLRAEKRRLERDEAWARREKRKQLKLAELQAKREKKAAAMAAKGLKPKSDPKVAVKSKAAPAPTMNPATRARVQGWAALQVNATAPAKRPGVARSPSAPTARVVYATPQPAPQYVRSQTIGHGHRAKPGMPSSQQAHRAQRPVRATTQPMPQPTRRPTAPVPATAAPRVVRSNSTPVQTRRR